MSYSTDYDKTKQINIRVSENDLADLELIRKHIDDSTSYWSNAKRADAIWAAVKLYKDKHKLKRENEE